MSTLQDAGSSTDFAEEAASRRCMVCGVDFRSSDAVPVQVTSGGAPEPGFACAGVCADRVPCPVCGVTCASGNDHEISRNESPNTPWERVQGVATAAGIDVYDLPQDACGGVFAGAVSLGFDGDGKLRGMLGLAEDLDDDLRIDVLAFGIAAYGTEAPRMANTVTGGLGIGRTRLPAARSGAGHLAWHIVRTCGRNTLSATFDLVDLDTENISSDDSTNK